MHRPRLYCIFPVMFDVCAFGCEFRTCGLDCGVATEAAPKVIITRLPGSSCCACAYFATYLHITHAACMLLGMQIVWMRGWAHGARVSVSTIEHVEWKFLIMFDLMVSHTRWRRHVGFRRKATAAATNQPTDQPTATISPRGSDIFMWIGAGSAR